MTVYGYARVSTKGQDLHEQTHSLVVAGVDEKNIFSEKFTGTTTDRPEFNKLMDIVKAGDTITVTKLDRFARNTREALEAIDPLIDNNVEIKVLNFGSIENTTTGRLIRTMLLAVAEMERDMIVERTQSGKAYAKEHNPNFREGRPKRVITEHYRAVYDYYQTHTATETEKAFNVSRATIFRIKRQIENDKG